jgi:hypothetical protein
LPQLAVSAMLPAMKFPWIRRHSPAVQTPAVPRYRASSSVVSTGQGEKVILLDLRSEQYYSLDDVGASIWASMTTTPTAEQISEQLAAKYDAPLEEIRHDVDTFVADLIRDRLVERV